MSHYILVVDDDEAMRYALRGFLEMLGYEVGEASNGVDALKAISRRTPDLMVLDVMMSPLTGWEVLQVMRDNDAMRGIRVVMLTALGHSHQEAYAWHLGCDWYEIKNKPVDFEDLALVIERLLAVEPGAAESALPSAAMREGSSQ